MDTFDLLGLQSVLKAISLEEEIPKYDEADIFSNPLDICRSYLAGLLCSLVGCEPNVAYRSIQCPNDITKGDFTVALPRLRPGEKTSDWTPDLMENVCLPSDYRTHHNSLVTLLKSLPSSLTITSSSCHRYWMEYT